MVEETFEPGMTVSLVARRHGVAPNQLFTGRRLVAQGGLDRRRLKRRWRKHLTVDQEAGGSSPPSCTSKINIL